MISLTINDLRVQVEPGTTVLEASRFYGFPIPTLCHEDGLTPYGACRLCLVEVQNGKRRRLVASCTLPVEEDMVVRTNSDMVQRARMTLVELYVAVCPSSKRIQDMASAMGVRRVRFERKDENCIQCGLCARICKEQMAAGAIDFSGRGVNRKMSRPFDKTSDVCRQCGACMYICPVCELRCAGADAESTLCSGCLNFAPVCLQSYDDAMCFLDPCHACEITGPLRKDVPIKLSPVKTE